MNDMQWCYSHQSPTVISQLYCGIVRPIIESNSPIRNPSPQNDIDMLDKVQRKCERLCSEDPMIQSLTTRRPNASMRGTYKFSTTTTSLTKPPWPPALRLISSVATSYESWLKLIPGQKFVSLSFLTVWLMSGTDLMRMLLFWHRK